MVIIIPGRLVGLNEYVNACRTNRYKGAKVKADAEELIRMAIKQSGAKPMKKMATISFRWIEPNKKRDLDNICFAKKIILDSLVKEKIIAGDGWRDVAGLVDTFDTDNKNPRIEVTLKEI